MRLRFACLIAAAVFMLSVAVVPEAEAGESSRQLLVKAKIYDGHEIVYEGELIGAVLRRGDSAWLNLYDGRGAIGVIVPVSLLGSVKHAGGYQHRGDWIRVKGRFQRACATHGGGVDIHASELVVLRQGAVLPEVLDKRKVIALFILSGVVLCLVIIRILRKRPRIA